MQAELTEVKRMEEGKNGCASPRDLLDWVMKGVNDLVGLYDALVVVAKRLACCLVVKTCLRW